MGAMALLFGVPKDVFKKGLFIKRTKGNPFNIKK